VFPGPTSGHSLKARGRPKEVCPLKLLSRESLISKSAARIIAIKNPRSRNWGTPFAEGEVTSQKTKMKIDSCLVSPAKSWEGDKATETTEIVCCTQIPDQRRCTQSCMQSPHLCRVRVRPLLGCIPFFMGSGRIVRRPLGRAAKMPSGRAAG